MPLYRALLVAVTIVVAGIGAADAQIEKWSRYAAPGPWQEEDADLPSLPNDGDLVEVDVDNASGNRYFIDARHIAVGDDGVTRLTLVTEPRRGARIITREGFRCETADSRVYAIANDDKWTATKHGDWRRVSSAGYAHVHGVLMSGAVCDLSAPRDAEKLVRTIRSVPRRVR